MATDKYRTVLLEIRTENVNVLLDLVLSAANRTRKDTRATAAYAALVRDIEDSLKQEMEAAERDVRTGLAELKLMMEVPEQRRE